MVLIDTTPLVALCDPQDSLNKTARRHLKLLAKSQFAICEPVLTEVCFHLSTPPQRIRLQRTLEAFNVSPVLAGDAHSLWNEVFEWLNKYRDHQPDWSDGYLAVLCGRDREFKVWTYDAEFRTVWRKPNGSAIPLAVKL